MKIIILGAGQVGGTLAEHLANENNDITIVDTDPMRLRELQDRLDIRTTLGMGSYPKVLKDAGADDADMLIAVTNSDEVNMIACQIAYSLFRTPTKIGRIRSTAYLAQKELFRSQSIPIDVLISPEQVVTNHIRRLIEFPGALQVLDFANGKVQLVAVKAKLGGLMIDKKLQALYEHLPAGETIVAAIYRRGRAIKPNLATIIEEEDEVFFMAAKQNIKKVMSELRQNEGSYRKIIIAGGGNIGSRLAKATERFHHVKIIDHNMESCQRLSEESQKSIIINGSATDKDLLIQENIEGTDVFCALTNDDEVNIMSSMLAKRLGAKKVMTLINKSAYVDLIQGGDIDIAISPQQITIGSLLTHVRRGDVVNVHSLRRGAAEAIEAIAHGDASTSKVVGRTVAAIELPEGATIGVIVRQEEVMIARPDLVIESNDHLVLFVLDKVHISKIERIFQVSLGFF